ncbi:peptide deformylase [Geomesophilobacter sediminis]|uniref:Peptide deformylase n=1 Tax=Geomesophilobacter sediminis TaxID=2798584 RepID=A0A8J7LXQ3_9BACT|nr:peptide deformylase [Geomesophilobacter sediminis]MBJ6723511.1 peptide deformylase [Geomesophilobacter sediminis]
MAIIRQIAQLGRPVLRKVAEPVADPTAPEIATLVADMLATCEDANGVGIAAPQVHESLALFIICPRPNVRYPEAQTIEPIVMMNPEIVWKSDEMESGWEGCLSVPGIRGIVPRHLALRVRFTGLDGVRQEAELSGFIARIFQHEYDHIRGMLYIDRADPRELATEKEYLNLLS